MGSLCPAYVQLMSSLCPNGTKVRDKFEIDSTLKSKIKIEYIINIFKDLFFITLSIK
jgi:hypothetical protein